MSSKIIVKEKTKIAPNSHKEDILTLYGVPECLDRITEKEKLNLLNMLDCGAIAADGLNRIAHSEGFFVEIPKGLRDALKSGKAALDKSSKNPGSFTPNIRIKGENGIQGQVTISKGCDTQAITQSIANLAMMSMVQSVLGQLDAIQEGIEDIKKGLENDRVASVTGAFKNFMLHYPYETQEELKASAFSAGESMQIGLARLLHQIDEERKQLDAAPKNDWGAFWLSVKGVLEIHRSKIDYYRELYHRFTYHLQLYNRLILLSDVILHLEGKSSDISKNHKQIEEYCQEYIDGDFRRKMLYLMDRTTSEIDSIDSYHRNFRKVLENIHKEMLVECKKEDVKYLSQE